LRREGHAKWREVDAALVLPTGAAVDPASAAVLRDCVASQRASSSVIPEPKGVLR
jgi:hypothetical protein